MTLLRLGTKDDVPKIMQVVKTVVHEMNSIEGNFQWLLLLLDSLYTLKL